MIQLLSILISAAALSLKMKEKMEKVLPFLLLTEMLGIYLAGVLGYLTAGAVVIPAACALCCIAFLLPIYKRDGLSTVAADLKRFVITPPILIFAAVCIAFCVLVSTHRVFNWDDLSYWGIYAKDLLCLGRLPAGVENPARLYKDYTPIVQITQFVFLHGIKAPGAGLAESGEAGLFRVSICLIYMSMLPMLGGLSRIKELRKNKGAEGSAFGFLHIPEIITVLMYIIFPHIFSAHFYFKLGVDTFMGLLFGYGIMTIAEPWFFDGSNLSSDGTPAGESSAEGSSFIFRYLRVAAAASYLALTKTSGIVLSLFLVILLLVSEGRTKGAGNKKDRLISVALKIMTVAAPVCFYYSWKIYAARTGNAGYLSDKVDSNIKGLVHSLPDYTGSVTLDYIRHVFTYPLTREKIGFSAALIVLMCLLILFIGLRQGIFGAACRRVFILMGVFFILFCAAHLYMYLFVFDEWEAEGLLEFDRYICQYLSGPFMLFAGLMGDEAARGKRRHGIGIIAMALLAVVLLPYGPMKTYLIPSNYDAMYQKEWKGYRDDANAELEKSSLRGADLPADGSHDLMVIGNGWSDTYQFFTYELVPQSVAFLANVPALEPGDLSDFIGSQAEERGIEYVYVMSDAADSYEGDFEKESEALTDDGSSLEPYVLYEVVKDGGLKLKKMSES